LSSSIPKETRVTPTAEPPGTIANLWSKFSGPGVVEFADEEALDTSATFSAPGIYVLRLTADDSVAKIIDEVTITVLETANPRVNILATDDSASEFDVGGPSSGWVTIWRTGPTNSALTVFYAISGSAANGVDYAVVTNTATIAPGSDSILIEISPVADALAEGDETVILTLSPSAAYNLGTNTTSTVMIHDRPWDGWRFAKFTTAELNNPDISGEEADIDLDGLPNLLEYAFDLEPKSPDTTRGFSGSVELDLTDGRSYFVVTFKERKPPTDLSYQVETTENLQSWNSGPSFSWPWQRLDDGDGITETVKIQILPHVGSSQTTRQFVRLIVTLQ